MMTRQHLLIIGGPTASGKSAVAIEIARRIGGQIISADSMQIYRGMDIGTATPSLEERGEIRHHMLSMIPPDTDYTAAMYKEETTTIIADLSSKGIPVVLCGGSGLYIDALTRPMDMAVESDEALRSELREIAAGENGKRILHDELKRVDPVSAARLHENDVRRVIRAIEVYRLTGRTMTEQNALDQKRTGTYDVSLYALQWSREALYSRINRRVDEMVEHGLVEEVQTLLEQDLPAGCTAMQAIGYKEISEALHGRCSMSDAVELVKQSSRRYAKRQITWFRRDTRTVWIEAEGKTPAELAEEILQHEEEKGYSYERI